jgi:predicted nucleic acid-binding protein
MTRLADAFYVEDAGSTLLLEAVNIVRNQVQAETWNAVAARAGAIAQIANTTIAENTGVEFGIVSFNSMITIQDTIIRQNTGSVRSA